MRFNITLPADLGRKVKASSNYSAVIAASLREKFGREEKERLTALLEKAYAKSAKEDRKITDDWDITTGDGL